MPTARADAPDCLGWIEWAPLVVVPASVCLLRPRLVPWEFMWLLSFAVFLAFKWQSWFHQQKARINASVWRNLAYLLLWPGMDARTFLGRPPNRIPSLSEWFAAVVKTLAGIALITLSARNLRSAPALIAGWTAMAGLILFLHFGMFEILALIWESVGINAGPIMRKPLGSKSLAEFWGRRWNMGFRELSHGLIFLPSRKRFGVASATMAAFLGSGLIHDFVISFPAHGGYGSPTAYFLLQGTGVLFERSAMGRRLGLGRGSRGWLFMLVVVAGPVFLLFHPPFLHNVILPFVAEIGSVVGRS